MMELDKKYVFHIPVYKFLKMGLIPIEYEEILDVLIDWFNQEGYDSLYITEVKGFYKSREFDELLITIFTSSYDDLPQHIFEYWFIENNDVLGQEAFAYECNNSMFVEKIMV